MKRILISGATGFTGQELLRQAISQNLEVTAIGRPGPRSEEILGKFPDITLIYFTKNIDELRERLKPCRPDALFHLASQYLPDDHPDGPQAMIEANISFPVTLLEALRSYEPVNVIAAGTQWQYAKGSREYVPNSFYAATKQAFQDIISYYTAQHGFRSCILNLSDCYGPDDPRNRIMTQLIGALYTGKPLDLSPGDQQLDFVHVSDVAKGFLQAGHALCDGRIPSGKSWALRGGRAMSLRDLVKLIEDISHLPLPVHFGALPYRPGTVMTLWPQSSFPGWKPQITLECGIATLIAARKDMKNDQAK